MTALTKGTGAQAVGEEGKKKIPPRPGHVYPSQTLIGSLRPAALAVYQVTVIRSIPPTEACASEEDSDKGSFVSHPSFDGLSEHVPLSSGP